MEIIVTGDPIDGFEFFGPFETVLKAQTWAEKYIPMQDWWSVTLQKP